MTREIKYRVWDETAGKFRDLAVYDVKNGKVVVRFPIETLKKGEYQLEQYTGLKDKNGKEIYEGDIFRNAINGGTWRVSWDENGAAFWVDSGFAGCSLGDFDWDRSNRKYGFIEKNCEVIGTTHENPELLEKGGAHE